MAYSPDDHKILLYGGRDPSGLFVNELWVYDTETTQWSQITDWNCDPCPAGRSVHSMVYDDFNNRFIVFGGYLISGHSFETNETWAYDLETNTWDMLDFGSQPIPARRHWGSLEYDRAGDVTYLFGGHFNNANCPGDVVFNDVWRLDIGGSIPTWTEMNPTSDPAHGKPAPRQSDLIYSKLDGKFYVFGGKSDLGPPPETGCDSGGRNVKEFNDIWRYDPITNGWTRVQGTQTDYTHYPKERRTDIIFDDAHNRIIIFGGLLGSSTEYAKETWLFDFDDGKWSTVQDVDAVVPPLRLHFAAVWHDDQDIMYIYGFSPADNTAQFWKFEGISSNISVNCFDRQPLYFGTDNNDNLSGNNAKNVMFGLLGDDTIRGGKGSDFLCGDRGNDILYGGPGNDQLFGYDGADTIYGGSGEDRVKGGGGPDTLHGNTGKDSFDCGSGSDTIIDYDPSQGDTKTTDCEKF